MFYLHYYKITKENLSKKINKSKKLKFTNRKCRKQTFQLLKSILKVCVVFLAKQQNMFEAFFDQEKTATRTLTEAWKSFN